MKKFGFLLGALLLLSSAKSFADVHTYGLGFVSPQINGKANVTNPEVGEILLDTSDNIFYGRDNSGTWVGLNAPAGSFVPSGSVFAFAGATAPSGYLLCDGSAISRSTYAALFAIIGTTYGAGDGSTTFNLPNTEGIFIRGAGSQTISSITYSGTLGASQTDQMQGHYHNVAGQNTAGPTGSSGSVAFGSPAASSTVSSAAQTPVSDGAHGTPRTGSETRPANISMNYIIKY